MSCKKVVAKRTCAGLSRGSNGLAQLGHVGLWLNNGAGHPASILADVPTPALCSVVGATASPLPCYETAGDFVVCVCSLGRSGIINC